MVRWLSAAVLLGLLLAAAAVLLFPPAASGPDSAVGGGPAADLPRHASPPDGTAQASAASLRQPPRTAPPVPAAAVPVVSGWERVERDCPWPPTLDSWTEVSGECDAAMMELGSYPVWRSSLRDPEGTRRTVVAALDDPQCRVPPGEKRPDLYEACAAEALIRFAQLQHSCVNVLGRGAWDRWKKGVRNLMRPRIIQTGDLEEHHRLAEIENRGFAQLVWGYSLCSRVPPGVLAWLDVLPVPEANPEQQLKYYPGSPVPTQAPELREIARRLGATRIPPLAGSPSALGTL
ncbi:MAG: hypothetical protein OXH09_19675 [Gammaproteobacteria bacterium]|nr:hypothetical protein [Gammaproteobacteria bacterium]